NIGFGEIIVSTDLLYQPTHQYEPGSPDFITALSLNDRSKLVIDDGAGGNIDIPYYDVNTIVRMGDEVAPITGVMSYATFSGVGTYRIHFTEDLAFTPVN